MHTSSALPTLQQSLSTSIHTGSSHSPSKERANRRNNTVRSSSCGYSCWHHWKRTCLGLCLITALGRIFWSLATLHSYDPTLFSTTFEASRLLERLPTAENNKNNNNGWDPWTLQPRRKDTLSSSSRTEYNHQRKARTRPAAGKWLFQETDIPSMTPKRTLLTLDHLPKQNNNDTNEYDWKTLCKQARLSNKSRILITGVFTTPGPSAALALLLSQQCGVQRVAGVDPMVPNLRNIRIAAMDTYKTLYRNVDKFQLIVPTQTAGLSKQPKNNLEELERFAPTHVVHFETPTLNDGMREYMTESGQRLYAYRHASLSLLQLLSIANRFDAPLLHVTTTTTTATPNNTTATVGAMAAARTNAVRTSRLSQYQHLLLPPVYGPLVHEPAKHDPSPTSSLFVDDALAMVLQLLNRPGNHQNGNDARYYTVSLDSKQQTSRSNAQKGAAYQFDQEHPYSISPTADAKSLREGSLAYRSTYGIHKTAFPCAASCTSSTNACESSVLEAIAPISVEATRKCQIVLYMVDFDPNLESIFQPRKPSNKLCRVAFVSGKSPFVQQQVIAQQQQKLDSAANHTESQVDLFNGKLKVNSFTLVWLPNHDETDLTDAEYALLRMEPSRFFANSVRKAMFTDTALFAEPPDVAVLRILTAIDRAALPRHYVKEHRPGTKVSRFVLCDSQRARSVALFGSEPKTTPKNVAEYANLAKAVGLLLPPRQVVFYKQSSHWIQMDLHRPEVEVKNTLFAPYPWQWVSMGLLVHDLHLQAAHDLRCSWLDEYLYWGGSNRDADELSLSYVIAKRRVEGTLGLGLEEDDSWIPFQVPGTGNPSLEEPPTRIKESKAEVFLRLLASGAINE